MGFPRTPWVHVDSLAQKDWTVQYPKECKFSYPRKCYFKLRTHTTEIREVKAVHICYMPFPICGCQQFISPSLRAFHELILIASLPATNPYCTLTVSACDTSFLWYAFSFYSGMLYLWGLGWCSSLLLSKLNKRRAIMLPLENHVFIPNSTIDQPPSEAPLIFL